MLIVLGIVYVCMGKEIHLAQLPFIPDFSNAGTIVLAASIFLFYAGMETQAVHINDMRNPSRDFPRAVFLSIGIIVVLYALGTLIIGVLIPTENINLLQSLLVAYKSLWESFDSDGSAM